MHHPDPGIKTNSNKNTVATVDLKTVGSDRVSVTFSFTFPSWNQRTGPQSSSTFDGVSFVNYLLVCSLFLFLFLFSLCLPSLPLISLGSTHLLNNKFTNRTSPTFNVDTSFPSSVFLFLVVNTSLVVSIPSLSKQQRRLHYVYIYDSSFSFIPDSSSHAPPWKHLYFT